MKCLYNHRFYFIARIIKKHTNNKIIYNVTMNKACRNNNEHEIITNTVQIQVQAQSASRHFGNSSVLILNNEEFDQH